MKFFERDASESARAARRRSVKRREDEKDEKRHLRSIERACWISRRQGHLRPVWPSGRRIARFTGVLHGWTLCGRAIVSGKPEETKTRATGASGGTLEIG